MLRHAHRIVRKASSGFRRRQRIIAETTAKEWAEKANVGVAKSKPEAQMVSVGEKAVNCERLTEM